MVCAALYGICPLHTKRYNAPCGGLTLYRSSERCLIPVRVHLSSLCMKDPLCVHVAKDSLTCFLRRASAGKKQELRISSTLIAM